jgi:SAM-dependent methyltransferase
MTLHRQHAAWLLGLEGAALLRHVAGDDLGDGFLVDRLAEVRRIVDAIDDQPLVDIGDIGVREGYAIWATTYDHEDNPLFGPDETIVRPLLDALPIGRVVDVACGTGRHAAHLASRGHDVVGFDLSPEMLAHASVPRGQADLRALPLSDDSVDAAIVTLALTYLPALEPAFAELARVVRPGGTIITSDIHLLSLYFGGVSHADGRRMPASRFFASDYIRAITAAELDIVSCHEPRWGGTEGDGAGGPLAQEWCPAASTAAYRDTPAAIVWELSVR